MTPPNDPVGYGLSEQWYAPDRSIKAEAVDYSDIFAQPVGPYFVTM